MKDIKALSDQVRQAAYDIHVYHGHGHLEKVYENALAHRLRKAGLDVQQQHPIKVYDEDGTLIGDYLADLLVEGVLILELKTARALAPEHEAQILGYLKSARLEHGLLINFGSYKFEIRKYVWSENQPQGARRTQRAFGPLISALFAFFAVILGSLALTIAPAAFAQETNLDPVLPLAAPPRETLRWLSPTNQEVEVCGLPWFKENGGDLVRLPVRLKSTFRPAVWSLARQPSGGRIRFRTDTKVLSVRVEYSSPPRMANMHAYGQTGVDLYANGVYIATAIGDKDAKWGKTYETVLLDLSSEPRVERDITLYLPLYMPAKVVGIGLDSEAKVSPAKPFAVGKPIVFYGTSITQGGCASRPGMSYEAILGRRLNIDFVNLGFSGNGLGEPEVAAAVTEIDASCFVLDFGANHKTGVEMRKVYAPFLDAVRARHSQTPIVVMTPLYTAREERIPSLKLDWQQRREYISQVVDQHVRAGDTNLFLVDGARLLGPTPGDGLVDGGHPNDLGFQWMADGLQPVLRKALRLR
jgi:GxxExxY protein